MIVQKVWWRRITSNDLYNIEKPLPPGPKGQLHIDVPNVPDLLSFFGYVGPVDAADWPPFEVSAKCFKDPTISSRLTFRPRPKNTRYDIPQQNLNAEGSARHPAWTSAFGWPSLQGRLRSTEEAAAILAESELRIVMFQDSEGEYYADFVRGDVLPDGWPVEMSGIFADKPAGCLYFASGAAVEREISPHSGLPTSGKNESLDLKSDYISIEAPNRRGIRHPVVDPDPAPPASSVRQGYGLTSLEKKAVESRALSVAIDHFANEGFSDIKDVGAQASYDLTMLKGGQLHTVEVKGTTGTGEIVILTRNEVEVHQKHFPHNALAVVSLISLTRGEAPVACGGVLRVIMPWEVTQALLEPIAFEYRLPS